MDPTWCPHAVQQTPSNHLDFDTLFTFTAAANERSKKLRYKTKMHRFVASSALQIRKSDEGGLGTGKNTQITAI